MRELASITKSEIVSGGCHVFVVDGKEIALHRDGEKFIAFDNQCPHKGANLNEGMFKNGVVTCPWHRFRFDLQTGQSLTNKKLAFQVYDVIEQGDSIKIVAQES